MNLQVDDSATQPRTIDVAIPCYNYGQYLPACVDSVLSQEVPVRVLIVDDASSDNSREVGQELARLHPQVEYTRHLTNKRHIATFNDGVDWASGFAFVLLSADDLLAPGSLRRSLEALTTFPSAGLVYGDVLRFANVPPAPITTHISTTLFSGHEWLSRRCDWTNNSTCSPEVVVRTDVQKRIGHYDSRLGHTSDLNMWLRAAAVADVARVRGATQAYYRVHSSNMSSTMFGSNLSDLEERRLAFRLFFEEDLQFRDKAKLERLAMRHFARDAVETASRLLDRQGHNDESDQLMSFALATNPRVRSTLAGIGFRLRTSIGPGRLTWLPPFVAGRAVRWSRFKRRGSRWQRRPD